MTSVFKLSGLVKGVTKSFFMNIVELKLSMLLVRISHLILNFETELHGMLNSRVMSFTVTGFFSEGLEFN